MGTPFGLLAFPFRFFTFDNFFYNEKVAMRDSKQLVPVELIENKIYLIRGQKVMLDRDLAALI